jgi:hypothetical protein
VDYVLVRAFESHEARQEQEARFYGSSEWRSGPREAIVSRIESDHTVVLTLAAEGGRRSTCPAHRRCERG